MMSKLSTRLLFLLTFCIYHTNAISETSGLETNSISDPNIILTLESPGRKSIMSGISNFQGWVVSHSKIEKIELFVDNKFIANIPFGGTRNDVGKAYPQYPDSKNSGFSMAFSYSLFKPGKHNVRVRAIDLNGNTQEVKGEFSTTRFGDTLFFPDPDKINLFRSRAYFPNKAANNFGHQVLIDKVRVDGKTYSILLVWKTASQKFEIHQITRK